DFPPRRRAGRSPRIPGRNRPFHNLPVPGRSVPPTAVVRPIRGVTPWGAGPRPCPGLEAQGHRGRAPDLPEVAARPRPDPPHLPAGAARPRPDPPHHQDAIPPEGGG